MKALDFEQQAVLDVIRAARRRHPDWPVVVAQTSLHEGYPPGAGHVLPYPFGSDEPAAERCRRTSLRALSSISARCSRRIPGEGELRFVPIDFTQAGDGFEPADYGREALIDALDRRGTGGRGDRRLPSCRPRTATARSASSTPISWALRFAAGASDAFPLAGIVAVPMVQAAMLRQLGQAATASTWDKRAYAEFAGALGAGTLVRVASSFGVRQLVKLIPVYGQTAGAAAAAAASFAATYAMGKAATHFLRAAPGRARHGEEVASVYRAALQRGLRPREGARHRRRRGGRQAVSEPQARPCGYSAPRAAGRGAAAAGAEPHSARQPLAVGARLHPLLGASATCVVVAAVYYLQRRLIVPLPAGGAAR